MFFYLLLDFEIYKIHLIYLSIYIDKENILYFLLEISFFFYEKIVLFLYIKKSQPQLSILSK